MVANVSDEEMQEHYDNFFEDVFVELEDKYGEIEEMNVCDNLGDHLVGNVYIKFRREEDAERAVKDLNNRWFGGRPVYAELSPVTDFREACCRQYEMGECTRSGFCNFMHLKPISRELRRYLYSRGRRNIGGGRSSRSRSRSRQRMMAQRAQKWVCEFLIWELIKLTIFCITPQPTRKQPLTETSFARPPWTLLNGPINFQLLTTLHL